MPQRPRRCDDSDGATLDPRICSAGMRRSHRFMIAVLATTSLWAGRAAQAQPSLRTSGGAPMYLVAGPKGIDIINARGARRIAPPSGAVALDGTRGWLWYREGRAIKVLDLRRPGTPPVRVVSSAGGDFGITYPDGTHLGTSDSSVQVSLRWDGNIVTAYSRRTAKPVVNTSWLAANKKRASRGGQRVLVSKTVAFGRTGWKLSGCALIDQRGRKRSPHAPDKAADPDQECFGSIELDRSGRWWIVAGTICSVKRCHKLPNARVLGWMKPGVTLVFPGGP